MRANSVIVIVSAFTFVSAPACAAPFPTTDQNPLLNGVGIPQPEAARFAKSGTSDFSATINWSNTAVIQNSSNETLVVDAESREWRLSSAHAISDKVSLRVQLPYRTTHGGSLDGFIEHWHSLFGLPNGDRPALPRNDLRIDYQRSGASVFADRNGSSGIGDVSVGLGLQLQATKETATGLWWSIKLPTGDSAKLTGNGAAAASMTLAHERNLSSRWLAFSQVNATYLQTGDLIPDQQRHVIWSGLAGFDYRYSNALALKLQLDAHTAAFKNTGLDLLGNAWILTLGGEYRWLSHWRMQLGVSEDVKVAASPDVNFVLSVSKAWQ